MRVLHAGGAGFIGSHIADALLARGDEVVAIDNFATGRRENVAHLSGNAKFTLIEHDITLPWPTHPALEAKFDAVLDKADGAVFFLTSTSEVYGDPLVHPQPETYWGNVSSIGPRSCYDEAKRFSEALTMAYHRVHGVDVRIVRIFNTYGERMRPNDGRVVNTFVVQALRGEPLTLHGDGSQTRSFCHVNDEVGGLMALLDSDYNLPVNVGNPGEFTMRELAELVVELTGSKSEIITVELPPEREGDPLQRKPDITVAKNLLGWEPTISLREGLKRMIKHFVDVEGIS